MGRGLGRVQWDCLLVIYHYGQKGEEYPTTFDIAVEVYKIEPDERGFRLITNAQHTAVKRALESLQRQGSIIGWGGRRDRLYEWMDHKGAARWIAKERRDIAQRKAQGYPSTGFQEEQVAAFIRKAKANGMKIPESE